jgi:hypothetical protein
MAKEYALIQIISILLVLYMITYSLSRKNIIQLITHRKIWNSLLLISFLVSGILGILLVTRINYGWPITFAFNMLFWHVQFGIAMTVIAVLHISWHWRYFLSIIRK